MTEPNHPCHVMPTCHCPLILNATCADVAIACVRFDMDMDQAAPYWGPEAQANSVVLAEMTRHPSE